MLEKLGDCSLFTVHTDAFFDEGVISCVHMVTGGWGLHKRQLKSLTCNVSSQNMQKTVCMNRNEPRDVITCVSQGTTFQVA